MLQGLCDSPSAVPFVRQFHGSPSRYLWENDIGEVRDIDQGEGGEQGDPLMPMLFSLGQYNALRAAQARLDDVYIITSPARVSAIYAILHEELWRHARIRIHDGKTQVWNRSGNRPVGCDVLDRAVRALDPEFTTVWRGGGELVRQGVVILGTPRVTRTLSGHSWNTLWRSTTFCWSGSLQFRMSNPLGHCCCIAPMPERIALFVWFVQIWPGSSRKLTMQGCGGVCAPL